MSLRRHSKKREQILEVLKKEHGALSVAEIHAKLPHLDISTIYRNLEIFIKDGEVKKLLLNEKEALYECAKESHHHAVCSDCKKVIHFKAPDAKLRDLLGLEDFEVEDIEVTVRGTCKHR